MSRTLLSLTAALALLGLACKSQPAQPDAGRDEGRRKSNPDEQSFFEPCARRTAAGAKSKRHASKWTMEKPR